MWRQMLKKLLSRTKKSGDCLEWTGCLNSDGYPRAAVGGDCNVKVHRLVYHLSSGVDPVGKVVRHMCNNPVCINPKHLMLGTPADNVKDRNKSGRTRGHVPEEEVEVVVSLVDKGMTYKQISEHLGIKAKRAEYINLKRRQSLGG